MIEIRIHGRGGQGGVTLAKIMAAAQHREGLSVQAFGIYAAERSGAPLAAFLRYDDKPINNPNQIYEPRSPDRSRPDSDLSGNPFRPETRRE